MASVFFIGLGFGIAMTLAVTLPMLFRAWGAVRREQQRETDSRIEQKVFARVSGILADIKHTQDAAGRPDPIQQKNIADAILFPLAGLLREAQRLQDLTAHVAAGGQPDDPPSKWMKVGKP